MSEFCACGCGLPIPIRNDGKKYTFIKGHGRRDYRIDATCRNCAKAIRVEPWRIERFGDVFCSIRCAKQHRAKNALREFICEYCGKIFILKKSKKHGKRVFCSYECFNEHRKNDPDNRVPVTCVGCGIEIRVYPSKYKLYKNFYCTIECRAKHIVGTNNPSFRSGRGSYFNYGPHWKSQRRKAIERDYYTCQYCGKVPAKRRNLHVHHIDAAYLFAGDYDNANRLQNLITLCHKCHKLAERGLITIQRPLL